MSFKTLCFNSRRIENDIEQNKMTLESLLSDPDLTIAMNQKLPKLTSFLNANVREIIEYSFSKDVDDEIKENAYSVLLDFQPVRSLICKDSSLINIIIQYLLNGNENTVLLLNLLRRIIESSNALVLHQIDQSSDFFQYLLNNLDKIYIREFLIFLVSHPDLAPFRKWLLDTNADELFYMKLKEEVPEFIQEKTLLLLSKYIKIVSKVSQVLQKLASKDTISYILNLGLYTQKISLSGESFKYIHTLCQSISYSERLKGSMSEIRSVLTDNCEQLCNFVQRDHSFFCDKQYAVELIVRVVFFKTEADNYVFNFAHFLLNLFIELKTNTFVHTSFLKLFRVLTASQSEFSRFVSSSQLMNKIVSLVDQKQSLYSSYWGHIYKISGILKKIIEDKQIDLDCDENWQNYIDDIYEAQHKIIKGTYGGPTPKNEFDDSDDSSNAESIFYHTHFIDSCDLLSRNYKQILNSSDSDEDEEEYEEETDSEEASSPSDSPSASDSNSE